MLYLVEHFYSIQGEGKYIGVPSVFFRFGGCNLNCVGFNCSFISPLDGAAIIGCDSAPAVHAKHFREQWRPIESLDELMSLYAAHAGSLGFTPDVVITGGEPLLHYADAVFYGFVERLVGSGVRVTFETNATIEIDFEAYPAYSHATFALAVKLANAGESAEKRLVPEALARIERHADDGFFKFTLDSAYLAAYGNRELAHIRTRAPRFPAYCMPMGDTRDELNRHDKAVARFCQEFGYYYSDRLQIRLYNDTPGV